MYLSSQSPSLVRARYFSVGILSLVLIGLAYGGAYLKVWLDAHNTVAHAHTFAYDLVIFMIWATVVLLTPALCFHIFSRSNAANTYWRAFWTFAFLAFLVHVSWAVFGTCGGDWKVVFHSQIAPAAYPECTIKHPGPDFFLTAWWALDVLLARVVSDNNKFVRVQRGAVHVLAFAMFFGATVLAEKAEIVARLLGIVMLLAVLGCVVLRLIVQENDPKSLTALVYVKFFEFLNLFVTWDKLPTVLAVLNLGALREVLRARNLYNTSDIAVTAPEGLRSTVAFDRKYFCEREEDGQYNAPCVSRPWVMLASIRTKPPTARHSRSAIPARGSVAISVSAK